MSMTCLSEVDLIIHFYLRTSLDIHIDIQYQQIMSKLFMKTILKNLYFIYNNLNRSMKSPPSTAWLQNGCIGRLPQIKIVTVRWN